MVEDKSLLIYIQSIYIYEYEYTQITQSRKLNVKGTKHNVGIKR